MLKQVMKGIKAISRGPKYSERWIKSLSDAEWAKEREIIRLKFCDHPNIDLGIKLQALLRLFDKVKREKDWNGVEPGFPVPREHGWYL